MAAGWELALARESHPARRRAMKTAEDAAKRLVPVDTGALRSTVEGEADETTMTGRLSAGDGVVDYAAVVELGGRPHRITAHGNYPLRNARTGQVFGHSVEHPGTPAQPYLRPGVAAIGGHK